MVFELDESEDYRMVYLKGFYVLKGYFFCGIILLNDVIYKFDLKIVMVYVNIVRVFCGEFRIINRRREILFRLFLV